MKISQLLVTAVVGKPAEEGIAPRFSVSRTTEQCGGSFIGETVVDIRSPGFPGNYADNLNCVWVVQHDCANSFTITPRSFKIEHEAYCDYDSLTIKSVGAPGSDEFCGDKDFVYNSDSSSCSGSSSSWCSSGFSSELDESFNALIEPITKLGNELNIVFKTDNGVNKPGFDIQITANLDNSCSADSSADNSAGSSADSSADSSANNSADDSPDDSADDTVQTASCFDGNNGGCSHHCSASVCSCPPCWTLGADGKQCEFEAGKAQVTCSGAGAEITIDKCALVGIDQSSIHLTDTTCSATEENADSWKIVTGFSDCGTQLGFSEDKFTLQNTLNLGYAVVGGRVVSRKYEIDFSCSYNNIATASSTIQASNVLFGDITFDINQDQPAELSFEFGLSFYVSDAYTTQADLTNGAFQPGNPLFARIAPTSALADSLEFSVGKCTVEDKLISESLVILDSCPVDGTNFAFQATQSDTTAVEFSFEGFVFPTSADDTTIDISCEVNVCPNNSPECLKLCFEG
uniref:Oikosin 6D protein n=1 Tax=Oikopleura dioica TaxID=34765 RepID=Q95PP6_OIKDI|nr:Oikosin 6D protein [Oikopleura dioica]